VSLLVFLLEPELGERRHERPRQNVGGQHREDHRFGEWNEQILGDAGELEHRHEHDADRQRGDERRERDLLSAFEDGLLDLTAVLEMVVDVLDGHRRIVDEDADRQGKAAQRHDVDGFP
jgi:hypothetical protein